MAASENVFMKLRKGKDCYLLFFIRGKLGTSKIDCGDKI